jgi:hypothetical protein
MLPTRVRPARSTDIVPSRGASLPVRYEPVAALAITVPHAIGKSAARKRVRKAFSQLENELRAARLARFARKWKGDRLTFTANAIGHIIRGRINVSEGDLQIELELPFFLGPVARRIGGRLGQEAKKLLRK